jgi:hypothetical protein
MFRTVLARVQNFTCADYIQNETTAETINSTIHPRQAGYHHDYHFGRAAPRTVQWSNKDRTKVSWEMVTKRARQCFGKMFIGSE